jgi:hypothetical protein
VTKKKPATAVNSDWIGAKDTAKRDLITGNRVRADEIKVFLYC